MRAIASSIAVLAMFISSGCKTSDGRQDDGSTVKNGPLFRSEGILAGEGQGWCPVLDADRQSTNIYLSGGRGPIQIGTMGDDGLPFRFVDGVLRNLNDLNDRREIYSEVYFAEHGIRSTKQDHQAMEFKIAYSELDCKNRGDCEKKIENTKFPEINTASTGGLVNVRRAVGGSPVYFKLNGIKPHTVTIIGAGGIATNLRADADGLHFTLSEPLFVKVLDKNNKPLYAESNPNQTFKACMN